jgi:hypothetical protein
MLGIARIVPRKYAIMFCEEEIIANLFSEMKG